MNPETSTSSSNHSTRHVALDIFGRPLHLKPCCLHVRHKMMYIDPAQASPGMVDDSSDSRVYICMLTQEVLGPDGALVSPSGCSQGRSCYCGAAQPSSPTIQG